MLLTRNMSRIGACSSTSGGGDCGSGGLPLVFGRSYVLLYPTIEETAQR